MRLLWGGNKMEYTYAEYAIEKTLQLLGIDSPTGYTARAAQWVR